MEFKAVVIEDKQNAAGLHFVKLRDEATGHEINLQSDFPWEKSDEVTVSLSGKGVEKYQAQKDASDKRKAEAAKEAKEQEDAKKKAAAPKPVVQAAPVDKFDAQPDKMENEQKTATA
jgi:hypothetical protein